MSADNMICVQKRGKKWYVWMDFASADELKPKHDRQRRKFWTKTEALRHAFYRVEREPIVEYGVRMLDKLE